MAVNLSSLGVDKRWHCLEVCGGAGLVARWLSAKFGADGRVVGTDIDPRFPQEPNPKGCGYAAVDGCPPLRQHRVLDTLIGPVPASDEVILQSDQVYDQGQLWAAARTSNGDPPHTDREPFKPPISVAVLWVIPPESRHAAARRRASVPRGRQIGDWRTTDTPNATVPAN